MQNCLKHSPFPLPSSIKLLARFPRIPELLRLFVSALALRISLLRLIIGVSANGSAIKVVFSSSSAAPSCFCRFFLTVTGLNSGLGERSCFRCDFVCAGRVGEEGSCSFDSRLLRRIVFVAASCSGVVGNFRRVFTFAVFGGAASSACAGVGAASGAFAFIALEDEATGSAAGASLSELELRTAGSLDGFPRLLLENINPSSSWS